jgi:hypothetical protein
MPAMAREADPEAQQVAKTVLRQQLLPIFQVTPAARSASTICYLRLIQQNSFACVSRDAGQESGCGSLA